MLSRDILILHRLGLFLSGGEDLAQARTEILLTTLHPWKTTHRSLAIVLYDLNVRSQLAEQRTDNPFRLLEHGAKNVLGLDLLILISLREFDRGLNGFLTPKCEFV
jgi:hypothetical protein